MNVAYQYCALVLVSVFIGSINGQCSKIKCYRNEIDGKGYMNCRDKETKDIDDEIRCNYDRNILAFMPVTRKIKPFYSIQSGALSVAQKYFNKMEALYLEIPFAYISNDTFEALEAITTLDTIKFYMPSKYLDPRVVLNVFDGPRQYYLYLVRDRERPIIDSFNLYFKSPKITFLAESLSLNVSCTIDQTFQGDIYHASVYINEGASTKQHKLDKCRIKATTKARNEATTKARNEARNEATTKARNETTTKDRNKANQLFCNIPLTIVFVLLLALMNQF